MAPDTAVIEWLMEGDPAIRWQVMRDLLDARPEEVEAERARVATEGWGAQFLALQQTDGSWGSNPYAKWNGTFYTMLVLRDLGLPAEHEGARRAARILLDSGHRPNGGGIRFGATGANEEGETCVSGMGMAIFARYHEDDPRLEALPRVPAPGADGRRRLELSAPPRRDAQLFPHDHLGVGRAARVARTNR